jgi:2-amino-4-hydroxy-6-hydroxymethyldihydropteridine diphosphokinase
MYVNAVAAFEAAPGLSPEALLDALKALERNYGIRDTSVRNSPRELDLDLLLYDDEVRDTPTFTLPHPRAVRRRFVLAPAAEVTPDLVWPGTGRTIRALLADLDSDEQVSRLDAHASV